MYILLSLPPTARFPVGLGNTPEVAQTRPRPALTPKWIKKGGKLPLGKRAIGVQEISVWDSRPLGRADAIRRALLVDLQLLFPPMAVWSLAWVLWDPGRQGLHDRMARSIVVTGRSHQARKL
jgi:hypothetical protein